MSKLSNSIPWKGTRLRRVVALTAVSLWLEEKVGKWKRKGRGCAGM